MYKKRFTFLLLSYILFCCPACLKLEKKMAVTTGEITDTSYTSATASGTIIDLGEAATRFGHYYSTTKNAQSPDMIILSQDPIGIGQFTTKLTNLEPGVIYWVRAFIGDANNTVLAQKEISFSTAKISVPVLTTTTVTKITFESAESGGNISKDGGREVISRGVCYSKSPNPTIGDSLTSDGSGTGPFVSNLEGLALNTNYYLRAYATNSEGTGYGSEVSFKTSQGQVANLTTKEVATITSTTAVSGGIITSNGSGTIIERGICWGTKINPTIADSRSTNASGTDNFISYIRELFDGTTYYVRAYVVNSAGINYGNQVTFITPVTDNIGIVYQTVEIGNQVWMKENLNTPYLNDDSYMAHIGDNTSWETNTIPAWCWVSDFSSGPDNIYGKLYNWYAVGTGKLCPAGWHVPTDEEFKILEKYLGMNQTEADAFGWRGIDQGDQLKSITGWLNELNGTNTSGFTGFPGNLRKTNGYEGSGALQQGFFWTSSEYDINHVWIRGLDYYFKTVFRDYTYYYMSRPSDLNYNKQLGLSVRCIKN